MSAAQFRATLFASLTFGAALGGQQTSQTSQQPPARGASYMNIGFSTLVDAGWSNSSSLPSILQGDHDPKVRGFTMPNTEMTLDGAVDPYFKGFASLVWKLDENGETGVEMEEAYVMSTSLRWNLQVKAGQFFADFGRQNVQHPHSWAFVDQPVILSRLLGPEGLRSQGMRLSWLAPTPFYAEAMVTVANSTNGTTFSFRSEESSEIHGGPVVERSVFKGNDMLIVPRLTTSFDLSGTQTVVLGASGAFGPNTGGADTRTSIYGADLYWKWKSLTAQQGFPFVSLQVEAMTRKYGVDARPAVADSFVTFPAAEFVDRGGYGQLLWGIKPRLVAGFRADVAGGDDVPFDSEFRGERLRLSPSLTWYPTEFSKLRFQYNYDDRKAIAQSQSLWIQFEFLLGAHAAHKF
jgi:hypothetical protein